jgi:hypothetical protein
MSIEAMKQAVVYFEHMVRTLKLRDESEPAQLLFKLRQAIEQAEKQDSTDWERIARVQDAKLRAMCGEPGAFKKLCELMDKYEAMSPTPQPPREWVGLTDEDKQIAFDDTQEASGGFWEFADAIEAKLKEKNGG